MRGPRTTAERPDDAGAYDDLLKAFGVLSSVDDVRRFLADLTTPAEREALAERWRIARLLDEGALSYRDIAAQTGASTATVVRVARCVGEREPGGYRRVMEKIRRRQKRKSK